MDEVVRDMGVDRQLDLDLGVLLRRGRAVPLELRNRLPDQTDVEVEADIGDVAGLLTTCLLYTSPSPRD